MIRASRYMVLLYASMAGVPAMILLRVVFGIFGMASLQDAAGFLAGVGLVVFGIVGFVEVYAHPQNKHIEQVDEEAGEAHVLRPGAGRDTIVMSVSRFAGGGKGIEMKDYRVKVSKFTTVLEALLMIKETQDSTLSVRYSCRMGICGSCGVVVNGKPSLACELNAEKTAVDGCVKVEQMRAHPLLKDLVTDFDDFFAKHKAIRPGLYRKDDKEKYEAKKEYKQSQEELNRFLPYSYCIMCGLCLDACPISNSNAEFLGPQALSQAYRYYADSRDQDGKKRLFDVDALKGIWGCEFAGACSHVCPKGVDPASAIQLLKNEAAKSILENGE